VRIDLLATILIETPPAAPDLVSPKPKTVPKDAWPSAGFGFGGGARGTIYWYMSPGIVAESDLTGTLKSEYVSFDGERVARKDFPAAPVQFPTTSRTA
jgi:hypothetical protein